MIQGTAATHSTNIQESNNDRRADAKTAIANASRAAREASQETFAARMPKFGVIGVGV